MDDQSRYGRLDGVGGVYMVFAGFALLYGMWNDNMVSGDEFVGGLSVVDWYWCWCGG